MDAAAEVVPGSSPDHPGAVRRKDRQKSRITNGSALLPGIGRSSWVRRCRDLITLHLGDLPDASVAEQSIIRRASTLTVELERMEAVFATAGEASPSDLEIYQRCANSLRRLLEAVGLQRRQRDVSSFSDEWRADVKQRQLEREAAHNGD
jgi:hypothetical protein